MKDIVKGWIEGEPYYSLYEVAQKSGALILGNKQNRKITLEHLLEICDSAVSYEGNLILAAVMEIFTSQQGDEQVEKLLKQLGELQKKIKYGLPTRSSVNLYEMGFSDRVLAIELSGLLNKTNDSKKDIAKMLKLDALNVKGIVQKYPDYYNKLLNQYLN
ncbi:hypothetical protein GZH47_32160 (plasmid) [Paenibacillus rhizovicinus]|uniref:Uncharacterized protein n=1 Tax=Paenibacillus rhizovicinus TaxID=2704463 RepID=A0A6C0PCW7_9BACL|nr:hypothetical protein [Paenibacillus rhizovicinus]QHW35542.1 hypothetical protein GZH47_32160 [Paenibacillus rhizovicinus]